MSNNAFGLIYTGEGNEKMRDLAASRAVSAIPFGGRYRVIDFILSNMVHTGCSSVGVICQKNYHSLMDHLGAGTEWDLNRKTEGLFILPPFLTKESTGIYRGSVDAIRSCLGYVRRCPDKYVILTGSHTIFNTSFDEMLQKHIESGADITVMYNEDNEPFDPEDQNKDVRLFLNSNNRVVDMEVDPFHPESNLKSCEVYIMDKAILEYLVEEAYSHGEYDFVRDVLLKKLTTLKVFGWKYNGLVIRLNSVKSYMKANMMLLEDEVGTALFYTKYPVYTKVKDEIPTKYSDEAEVSDSLFADGCNIEGKVERSIVFRGTHIGPGSSVSDSIIMQGAKIGKNVTLSHVILDKSVTIQDGRTLSGYENFPLIIKKNTVV